MRDFLRKLIIQSSSLVSKPKSGVYIMNGHYLSRLANNDAETFLVLLKKLSRFARFINIQEAVSLVRSGEAAQVDETIMAFTFDDGFDDCCLSLAPALDNFGVNACFFVNPGFIQGDSAYRKNFTDNIVLTEGKKPMSWEQVKSLSERGFVIGNHTADHVRLSAVALGTAEEQVIQGKQAIERELNIECRYFAWPFGQYEDVNVDVVNMLLRHHSEVFSGCDYTHYTSFNNRVFNRRHFEADWPVNEVKFFLAKKRVYAS